MTKTHLLTISTTRTAGAQLVSLTARFAIPERFVATIRPDDPTRPICHLDIAVTDGRPTCRALTLEAGDDDQQLDGTALRAVPLATYVKRAVDAEAMTVFPAPDPAAPMFVQVPGEEPQRLRSEPFDAERIAVRLTGASHDREVKRLLGAPRAVVTDEMLLEVADVYRTACARREPPTQAVMVEWHVARSTASRWIRRARDAGRLGPARARKAGERAGTDDQS